MDVLKWWKRAEEASFCNRWKPKKKKKELSLKREISDETMEFYFKFKF